MQDPKVKFLSELLGVNEDLHYEYYLATTQLLNQGLVFPLKLHIDSYTPENIIYSWLGLYRNYLQLVSSLNAIKVIDDYPGKMQIWDNDEMEFMLVQNGQVLWQEQIKIKNFESVYLDKMINIAQITSFAREDYHLIVKLIEPGFERKFNENAQYSANNKMMQELYLLKEKIVYAHMDSVQHLHSSEQDFYGQLSRVIHRLKLWGYEFSGVDYYSPKFTQILKDNINLSPLNFRHTYALNLVNQLFLEPMDNQELLQQVHERLHKEQINLTENYEYLKKLVLKTDG